MAYGDLAQDAPLKPNKGHEGGACNRRSCQAEPALYYNHGMSVWYCADCARDIGQDPVNLRDWTYRWKPKLGHDQFETREQIDAREAQLAAEDAAIKASDDFNLPPELDLSHYRDLQPKRGPSRFREKFGSKRRKGRL